MSALSRPLLRAILCLAILGLIVLLGGASPARAHENVVVGSYELILGWRVEPAVAGVLNGPDVGIEAHLPNGTTVWVEGAEASLNATLSFGSATLTSPLDPQFERPGWYTFDVIPTRDGVYSLRLWGTLNTTSVDETVPLDPVVLASSIEFPLVDPTTSQLALENEGLRIQMILATGIGVTGFAIGALALALAVRSRRSGRDHP